MYNHIVLACQGGGALGAYQMGVYQALQETGVSPNFFSGVSIGAITASILAGNSPEKRLEKLHLFWDKISWPENILPPLFGQEGRRMQNTLSAMQSMIFGQPSFFEPRLPNPHLAGKGLPENMSYYDTRRLRDTLKDCIDFEVLTQAETRLQLYAVHVKTGELCVFDNKKEKITPDHIMASCAMPPIFPGIRIGGDLYWDGGCSSESPIEKIYETFTRKDQVLLFITDLHGSCSKEPETIEEVTLRLREISHSTRTKNHIRFYEEKGRLTKELQKNRQDSSKSKSKPSSPSVFESCPHTFDMLKIDYTPADHEVAGRESEFSKLSIAERAQAGYRDTKALLSMRAFK